MLISVNGVFFTLKQRSLFLVHGKIGVKTFTSLLLKFSELNEDEFCHNAKIVRVPFVTMVLILKQLDTFPCVFSSLQLKWKIPVRTFV